MKFMSYITRSGQKSWGALAPNGKIMDLSSRALSVAEFVRKPHWADELEGIRSGLAGADLPLTSVELLSPIPNPPSMRDGYAFRQHVESARRNRGLPMIAEFDDFPIFYYTNHQAVIGPGPCHVQKGALEQLDFELEAAVVIGKEGINLKASEADDYIFGYTIMNDFSARKFQMDEMKLNLGPAKGKDFATALGPWIATRDELAPYRVPSEHGERFNMEMFCEVNGVQVSRGNLKDMTWTFAQILERASYGTYLYPGDVIGSGTVGTGCFLELNGSGITKQWLKPGDKITLKITGLGELSNEIVEGVPPPRRW